MRTVSDFSELAGAPQAWVEAQAAATSAAMAEAGTGALNDLRAQVRNANLGNKLAFTWRLKLYPGRPSLDPAAYIWSKAPTIIDVFDKGATIVPTAGHRYLAVPTLHVPHVRGSRKMTPAEVESRFNQDLIIRKARSGNLLAFVDLNFARWSTRTGRFSKARGAPRPKARLELMFTLVPIVRLGRRLDIGKVADAWSDRVAELIDKNWPS